MRQVSKTYIALAVISLLIALGYLDLADAQNLEQHNMKSQPKGEPIERFLTSDGHFDLKAANQAGIEGPIDIGNFIGEIDSETGELIFNPPSITDDTSDHNWMEGFNSPGLSAYVLSLAIYDNDLIVGGGFYTVGRITANNIARWDGSHWTTLGTGMNDDVSALIVYNGELIAGGGFTIAGGVSARRIARWNGNNWSAIDNGMDSGVNALAIYNGDLIAGGYFNTAGVVTVNRIARWNGISWSALGSGMDNFVDALAIYNGNLIAGGYFTIAGGVDAHSIAYWNGSNWNAMGSGMNEYGWVMSLAIYNNDLIVAGQFSTAGGIPANNIARWNGSIWNTLGNGISAGSVKALAVYNANLFAAGFFRYAGDIAVNNIAKWDGSTWSAVGGGLNENIHTLAVSNGRLFAGGNFTAAGVVTVDYLASWEGSNWSAVGHETGNGMSDAVSALSVYNANLVAGGEFNTGGGAIIHHIARWNGIAWNTFGGGLNNHVYSLTIYNGDLIAGGQFTTAGSIPANYIARWNGSTWSALGSGMNNGVYALAVFNGDLIAGGYFNTAGGIPANYIARWNGSTWSALGSGMNTWGVNALAIHNQYLVAGGSFTTAGGVTVNNIARWNGSTWTSMATGMNDEVHALYVYDGNLIAGGRFTIAGGVGALRIAKWNGSTWSTIGSGMNSSVYALTVYNGDLIAGGYFTTAGGIPANSIACWNGSTWSALGHGIPNGVSALISHYSDLVAGGRFFYSGGKVSSYIAFWFAGGFDPNGVTLQPELDSASIGGKTIFILAITNNDTISSNFNIDISATSPSWFSLADSNFYLLSGQSIEDTIFINVPSQAGMQGDYPFDVNVYVSAIDSMITRSAILRVVNNPIVASISPLDSIRTSSGDVDFSWYTSAICSTEVFLKPSDSSAYEVYSGPPERSHSITVTGLARNRSYDWYIRSAGDWGGVSTSLVRHFFIENGVVFSQESYGSSIAKDYNQRFAVGIINTDSIYHTVRLEAENNYSDIAINFVGDGSLDNLLLLNPNQAGICTLAVHAQDAQLTDYSVHLRLTSVEGADTIVDFSMANIHVNTPVINGVFEEDSIDVGTLAKNYHFTNLGDPITDLIITASESLDARIYFEPQMTHGYLNTGQTVFFKAVPVLSPADTSGNILLRAEGKEISYPSEKLLTIAGNITANFMGASITREASFTAPPGERIFLGHVDGIYRCFHINNWYCTNKPDIYIPWRIPPMDEPQGAFFQFDLTPRSGWGHRPHNIYVYVNDHLVGSLLNIIPNGTYPFPIDPSYLNTSPSQVSLNTIHIHTTHMNGGHYVVSSNINICTCQEALEGYISAVDQEQANQRLLALAGVVPPAANIGVTINAPLDGANIDLGAATTIRAAVTADGQPGLDYPVTATFSNGDQSVVMWDDGQHEDGAGGDGVYAGRWNPGHQGACAIIVRAGNCTIFGQDDINVNIVGPSMLNITVNYPGEGFHFIKGRSYNITATARDNFGNVVRGMLLNDHWIALDLGCEPGVTLHLTDLGTTGDGGWEDGTYGGYWTPNPESPGPCQLTFSASSPTLGSAQAIVNGQIIEPSLMIFDGAQDGGQPLADKDIFLYKVFGDHTEEILDVLHTDLLGKVTIPSNLNLQSGENGDHIKVKALSHRELSHRPDHALVDGIVHEIFIDNAVFDANGYPEYDSYLGITDQQIHLKHTTVIYNLVISIQWDADREYIESLRDGFKLVANYLYDVTDGQCAFGKIAIIDKGYNDARWWSADLQILATNDPEANGSDVGGDIYRDFAFVDLLPASDNSIYYVNRSPYFDDLTANAQLSYELYPYNWEIEHTIYSVPFQHWDRYYPCIRAISHELGHYLWRFGEEYKCCQENGCGQDCIGYTNYSLMDRVTYRADAMSSEMSSSTTYQDYQSPTSMQWKWWNTSCWGRFESIYEGQSRFPGPGRNILVPEEEDYETVPFPGPNDNLADPTVDVGAQIEFVISDDVYLQTCLPDLAARFTAGEASIKIIKDLVYEINQGFTSANGNLRILGADCSDMILANKISYAVGNNNFTLEQKKIENLCSIGLVDSIFALDTICNYLPATPIIEFQEGAQIRFGAVTGDSLLQIPHLGVISGLGTYSDLVMNFENMSYWCNLPDPLGNTGQLIMYCSRDSASSYFINSSFDFLRSSDTLGLKLLRSSDNSLHLQIDSLNTNISKAFITSTDFPVLRLEANFDFVQVSRIYSFSTFPASTELLGENILNISYDNNRLHASDEYQLTILSWSPSTRIWSQVNSEIDTVDNTAMALIDIEGTYAVFERLGSDCQYIPGDINGNGQANGIDVVYGVSYFKGGSTPPDSCDCPPRDYPFYAVGDVNANCAFNGIDIVYYVCYLKGCPTAPELLYCPDCPPAGSGPVVSRQIKGIKAPDKAISEPIKEEKPIAPIQRPVLKPRGKSKASD